MLQQQGMWREKWVAARNFLHLITSFSASESWLVRAIPLQSLLLRKGTINLVIYLYTYRTHHKVSCWFTILLWDEIGRQHVKAKWKPLSVHILISSIHPPTHPPNIDMHECERRMKSARYSGALPNELTG